MKTKRIETDSPLPCNLDAERFVLGAVLVGGGEVLDSLTVDDFSVEKHRLLYRCMREIRRSGIAIDRVTVYNELDRSGKAEAVGGLSYIVSLDDGMPQLYNAEDYIEILREKSRLRSIIAELDDLRGRALAQEGSANLLAALEHTGQRIAASLEKAAGPLKSAEEIVEGIGVQELLRPTRTRGIEPPFAWLRRIGFAFGPSTLTTVAAGTSVGKSAFLRQCAVHAALNAIRTALYSLEVPKEDVIRSSVAQLGSVNMQRFRSTNVTEEEFLSANEALHRIVDSGRLFLCDEGHVTVADIRRELTRAESEGNPFGFLVIDYLQLMTPLGRFSNRAEEVSSLSRGAKVLSQTFGIPVLVASQLSRDHDKQNRPPRLSDLRESGSIENDSNNVILMYRKTSDPKEPLWRVRVHVAKQRFGSTEEQDMWFVRRYTRFDEIEDEMRDVA
jgi:replicative DNA helicase